MLTFGQFRLSKGWLCPARLGNGLRYGPAGLESPTGLEIAKKNPPSQIIFKNPRSSIKPESAPDTKINTINMLNIDVQTFW